MTSTWTTLFTLGLILAGCSQPRGEAPPDANVFPPRYTVEEGWVLLFDGVSFEGWTASERDHSFQIVNGMIVAHGRRAHLFYTGDVEAHRFRDFHFKADVRTTPGSNSGIYFHTAYQAKGWPSRGYEAQINNTHRDIRRTGGLYGVEDVLKAPAGDNAWFTYEIIVQGNEVTLRVDGKTTVEYTEPPDPRNRAGVDPERVLSSGTFAVQAHDRRSKVYFANMRARPL